MNILAIIQSRDSHHLASADYFVHIYDKSRPRNINADNPCARYGFIMSLGPFVSKEHAARVAYDYVAAL